MKTIKDIAKLANVSTGTVDRVIHNRGGVAEKTRIKIKKIVDDLNFTPNLIAQNLVLKKDLKVAILIPKADNDSPFWKTPKKGIMKALREVVNFGFNADFFHYNQFNAKSYEQQLDKIIGTEYNGLILVPHFTKETILRKEQLNQLNIPYIFVNVDLDGFENICFIGQNSFKSGYLAGKLFNLTLPRNSTILTVNFLENLENHRSFNNRLKGIKNYIEENNVPIILDELKVENFSKENLRKLLTKKLISNNNIKGIYLPSTKISEIAQYLEEFDIHMDAVIGHEITKKNIEYVHKNLITFLIGQESFNQGYESVKIIFNLLAHNNQPSRSYFSPLQIITKENIDTYTHN